MEGVVEGRIVAPWEMGADHVVFKPDAIAVRATAQQILFLLYLVACLFFCRKCPIACGYFSQ